MIIKSEIMRLTDIIFAINLPLYYLQSKPLCWSHAVSWGCVSEE